MATAFARPSNTLMEQKAFGRGRYAPMINPGTGGQGGHLPDWPAYLTNTPYVRRNMVIRVLAGPRGFNYLPEPERWFQTLKAVLEIHPESVEGFNAGLEVEVRDVSYGGAGERQEAIANVTRARVEPVFNYVEKYGRPFTTFFERWVTELLMDPNTKYPNIVTRVNAATANIDLLPDFTSATIIAFEPDPTFTKIDKAWIVADLKPKGTLVPVEGKRDIHNGGDLVEFSINMTGIAQIGAGVDIVAQSLLSEMISLTVNPLAMPALTEKPDGNIAGLSPGYKEKLEEASKQAIPGF